MLDDLHALKAKFLTKPLDVCSVHSNESIRLIFHVLP
jgi:hypothetical protein